MIDNVAKHSPGWIHLFFFSVQNWFCCCNIFNIHSSKFSKRNYIFPLHSQKLETYFGQISPNSTFLLIRGLRSGRTGQNNIVFGEWRFLVWREIQIRKNFWTVICHKFLKWVVGIAFLKTILKKVYNINRIGWP